MPKYTPYNEKFSGRDLHDYTAISDEESDDTRTYADTSAPPAPAIADLNSQAYWSSDLVFGEKKEASYGTWENPAFNKTEEEPDYDDVTHTANPKTKIGPFLPPNKPKFAPEQKAAKEEPDYDEPTPGLAVKNVLTKPRAVPRPDNLAVVDKATKEREDDYDVVENVVNKPRPTPAPRRDKSISPKSVSPTHDAAEISNRPIPAPRPKQKVEATLSGNPATVHGKTAPIKPPRPAAVVNEIPSASLK